MVRATSLLIAALLVLSGTAAVAKKKPRRAWGSNRTAVQHDMGELLAPGAIAAIREGMHGTAPAEAAMHRMHGTEAAAPHEDRAAARGGEHERGPSARSDRSTRPSAARVTWHVQPQGGAEHGGGEHEGRAPVRARAIKGARH